MYVAVEMRAHWIGAAPKSSGQCPNEASKDPGTQGRSPVRTEQGGGAGGGACRRGRRRRPWEAGKALLRHRHREAGPVSTSALNSGPSDSERTRVFALSHPTGGLCPCSPKTRAPGPARSTHWWCSRTSE